MRLVDFEDEILRRTQEQFETGAEITIQSAYNDGSRYVHGGIGEVLDIIQGIFTENGIVLYQP